MYDMNSSFVHYICGAADFKKMLGSTDPLTRDTFKLIKAIPPSILGQSMVPFLHHYFLPDNLPDLFNQPWVVSTVSAHSAAEV
jgi:hypothetical protein